MILPERVLGRLSPKRMSLGLGDGADPPTWSRSCLAMVLASSPWGAGASRRGADGLAGGVVGRPTTAASATSSGAAHQGRFDLHRAHAVAGDVEHVVRGR